jgi:hypothetical protein
MNMNFLFFLFPKSGNLKHLAILQKTLNLLMPLSFALSKWHSVSSRLLFLSLFLGLGFELRAHKAGRHSTT